MAVEITFLGHSGFLFSAGEHQLVVDPFLTGNPLAKHQPEQITCQMIALTHGHSDHMGDAVQIAKANHATVLGTFEITEYMAEQGVTRTEPINVGGQVKTPFGWIAMTQAFHSSSLQGRYMGMPAGLMIHMGGVTIYHCGDTGLFSDMKLLGEIYQPDIACVPVGDRFTMGPVLATKAAQLIQPKVVIPIHYKTFDLLESDITAFTPEKIPVQILEPGQTWRYA